MFRGRDSHLAHAHSIMDRGERAMVTIGGVRDGRSGILVATNKRVLFFAKRLVGHDMEVFPYENISSLETQKALLSTDVTLFASGNRVSVSVTEGNVIAFLKRVKTEMDKRSSIDASPDDSADPMDQLAKLGELRDKGVLSKTEFESKKAEILDRI